MVRKQDVQIIFVFINLLLIVRKQDQLFVLIMSQRLHSIVECSFVLIAAEVRVSDNSRVKETYRFFPAVALEYLAPKYKKENS